MVQPSGFLASSPTVEIDTRFEGFKGFLYVISYDV
jgi:uncharacterized protein (AIM24 family)